MLPLEHLMVQQRALTCYDMPLRVALAATDSAPALMSMQVSVFVLLY
jgi:hypothetical protein